MKFSDIFVPRWQNSNPEVRKRAVERINDIKLLAQIAEIDDDPGRLPELHGCVWTASRSKKLWRDGNIREQPIRSGWNRLHPDLKWVGHFYNFFSTKPF